MRPLFLRSATHRLHTHCRNGGSTTEHPHIRHTGGGHIRTCPASAQLRSWCRGPALATGSHGLRPTPYDSIKVLLHFHASPLTSLYKSACFYNNFHTQACAFIETVAESQNTVCGDTSLTALCCDRGWILTASWPARHAWRRVE